MTKHITRITGALIASPDGEGDILDGTDLWIADGRILALLPAGSPAPQAGPVETLVFENALVMPGMINAHSHSMSALLRGTNPGMPLDLFLMEATARRTPKDLAYVRAGAISQSIEMLKSGVTAVLDHFRFGGVPTIEAMSAALGAYAEIGIRATVAPMFQDKTFIDTVPYGRRTLPPALETRWRAAKPADPDAYFGLMRDLVAEGRRSPTLKVMLGVDGPLRCTPRTLERTADFAAQHNIGNHAHLLEAKTETQMVPADCGGSVIAYLDRYGLVDAKHSLAHFVWCTERDIALCAERGINVVHNPSSNLLLGSGLQPTARLLRAGVNVALGSDGSSGSNVSLFEKARLATMLSRISELDYEKWIGARQAIRMATVNGGPVLGEPGLGTIRVGAPADLAILDLTTPVYRPRGDLWNHLAFYETGASVDTVLVGGEVVLRRGRCTRVNEDDVFAEVEEITARELRANGPFVAVPQGVRKTFEPLVLEALGQPAPVNRFADLR